MKTVPGVGDIAETFPDLPPAAGGITGIWRVCLRNDLDYPALAWPNSPSWAIENLDARRRVVVPAVQVEAPHVARITIRRMFDAHHATLKEGKILSGDGVPKGINPPICILFVVYRG